MCGIFGYLGYSRAAPIIYSALKRLEYRGYDSVGIATLYRGRIFIKKDRGKIEEVHSNYNLTDLPGCIGIGHTRWATHGAPSKENAHPHTDCKNMVAIVHNGIIENYGELRKKLFEEGHTFRSKTDSEIIAHLLEDNLNYGLKDAMKKTVEKLEGSYAIVAISTKEPNKLVVAKNESPLIIGVGEDGLYCASDIPALIPYVNNSTKKGKVIRLEDREIAELSYEGIKIDSKSESLKFRLEDLQEKPWKKLNEGPTSIDARTIILHPRIETIDIQLESVEKNGYPHFMLKEIEEQPESLKKSLCLQKPYFEKTLEYLLESEKTFATGAGTSYHACLAGLYMFNELAGKMVVPVRSSELIKQYGNSIDKKTAIIAVTQSGETADTLAAVKFGKKKGAKILGITNTLGSAITKLSNVYIIQNSGPEIGVAATKTFTSQLSVIFQLALESGRRLGKIKEKEYLSLYRKLKEMPSVVEKVIEKRESIKEIVKKYKNKKSFGFLGRGISTPVAYEGRLKFMELNYLPCISYPAGESKHGPISVIEEGFPVVAIAPNDDTHAEMISNIEEMKSRGAKIIAIAEEGDKEILELADELMTIPKGIPSTLTPIPISVELQIFSYEMCVARGKDPDKPRNLAKSVTVK